jgi:hypothetical protein
MGFITDDKVEDMYSNSPITGPSTSSKVSVAAATADKVLAFVDTVYNLPGWSHRDVTRASLPDLSRLDLIAKGDRLPQDALQEGATPHLWRPDDTFNPVHMMLLHTSSRSPLRPSNRLHPSMGIGRSRIR